MSDDVDVDLTGDGVDDSAVDDKTAKILASVRRENAKRRVENRELKERYEQLQADFDAITAQYETEKGQLTSIQTAREAAEAERKRLLDELATDNEAIIAGLPDKLRSIVPPVSDTWELNKWLRKVSTVLAPSGVALDGEAGSVADRRDDTVAVGEAEATLARALGIDPQELVKRVNKRG